MRMTTLLATATVVYASNIGLSSAADDFAVLKGVRAVPMAAAELQAVKGMDHHFTVLLPSGEAVRHDTDQHQDAIGVDGKGKNFVLITFSDGVERLVAPSYRGLMQACGNGVIDGPGFLC